MFNKKKLKLLIVCLTISSVIFISCEEECPQCPVEENITSGWPLAVGNYWVYRFNPANTTCDAIYRAEITNLELISNENWFKMVEDTNDVVTSTLYCIERDSGFCARDSIASPVYLKFKYPAELSDQFVYKAATYTVMSINEPVEVFAGSFTCFYIYSDQTTSKVHIYYAPEIGMILEKIYYYSNEILTDSSSFELLGYKHY